MAWLKSAAKRQQDSSTEAIQRACEELRESVEQGSLGQIVAKLETLILRYYTDVLSQANQSFFSARRVAWAGFAILVLTLGYALVFDALTRFDRIAAPSDMSMTVARVGVVSATLIEFIAAVNFWLYAKGARQFSAFHICLERTHRYLLAYKIADQIHVDRDLALRNLACIMASAPMIGQVVADNSGRDPNILVNPPVVAAASASTVSS